ncbi:thioesterase family protein [Pseudomonas sp. SH1-B]
MQQADDILWSGPIIAEWTDYNGHLRDAFYLYLFSLAGDNLMARIGLDEAGRASSGHSMFTLECHLLYLQEVKLGQIVEVRFQLIEADAKRLHLAFTLNVQGDETVCAAAEQMWLNVAMAGPKSAPFAASVAPHIDTIAQAHRLRPRPEFIGRTIGLPSSR